MVNADLRCIRHKHGRLEGHTLVVLCRQCSKDRGETVFHRWDLRSGQRLDADEHNGHEEGECEAA